MRLNTGLKLYGIISTLIECVLGVPYYFRTILIYMYMVSFVTPVFATGISSSRVIPVNPNHIDNIYVYNNYEKKLCNAFRLRADVRR